MPFPTFLGLIPKQPFQGSLELLFLSGFAGNLASDRMNEIRNDKVKVKFLLAINRNFTIFKFKGDLVELYNIQRRPGEMKMKLSRTMRAKVKATSNQCMESYYSGNSMSKSQNGLLLCV